VAQADHDLTIKQLDIALRRQDAAHKRHNTATAMLAVVRKPPTASTGFPAGTAQFVPAGSMREVTSSAWNAKAVKLASAPTTVALTKSTA
jgi:hypothetical protein